MPIRRVIPRNASVRPEEDRREHDSVWGVVGNCGEVFCFYCTQHHAMSLRAVPGVPHPPSRFVNETRATNRRRYEETRMASRDEVQRMAESEV